MEFSEYEARAVATAIYGEGHKVIYPALGLANEAGEVLGKIKKVLRDSDGKFDSISVRTDIAQEIGDVLWYIAALSRDLEIPLDEIAVMNLQKLADRQSRNVIGGSGDHR